MDRTGGWVMLSVTCPGGSSVTDHIRIAEGVVTVLLPAGVYRERGGAVDSRTSSDGASNVTCGCGTPVTSATTAARHALPRAAKSIRTVVRAGVQYAAPGTSSNPTTLTSPGTSRPTA